MMIAILLIVLLLLGIICKPVNKKKGKPDGTLSALPADHAIRTRKTSSYRKAMKSYTKRNKDRLDLIL